ncbi:MAG: hypothetical protein IJ005_04175 [Bacteroidales bacterium]|nr:hypothetical protein [Bacteroidales bacterium]
MKTKATNPYTVPEGYFDDFRERMAKHPALRSRRRVRIMPSVSVAAAVAVMLTAGTLFLTDRMNDGGITHEDYMVFSDNFDIMTIYDEITAEDRVAEADILDEDIIDYLIYIGVSAEEIELSK